MRIVTAVLLAGWLGIAAGAAQAADLSGVWEVDQPAWTRQTDRIVASVLAQLPPEAAAQMRAQGIDPATAFREAASAGLDGTVEFMPGGLVRTTTPEEGAAADARWSLTGNELTVQVDDAEGLAAMVGRVEGDRITLRPVLASDDPDLAFMRELVFPLVRRR